MGRRETGGPYARLTVHLVDDSPAFAQIAAVARKLGIDPAVIATEPDPYRHSVRLAAAILYQQADEKAEAEQKIKNKK